MFIAFCLQIVSTCNVGCSVANGLWVCKCENRVNNRNETVVLESVQHPSILANNFVPYLMMCSHNYPISAIHINDYIGCASTTSGLKILHY